MQREQYGRKRLVVGSHSGHMRFLVQRMSAVILALYSIVFILFALFTPMTEGAWRTFFSFHWGLFPAGQLFASLAFLAMAWHVFIGIIDVFMDYIKPAGIRLGLQVFAFLWILASIIYFFVVVWSIKP